MTGKRKILYIVLAVLLSGAVVAGFLGKYYYRHFVQANTVQLNQEDRFIYLRRKSTPGQVCQLLVRQGLVRDSSGLYAFMLRKNYRGGNIVPGKYKIEGGWSNNRLINHLRAGNGRIETRIVITQVRDAGRLARKMARELLLDSAAIAGFITNRDSMDIYGFDLNNQMNMFIPNTYFVDWDITPRELTDRLYREYTRFWTPERLKKASEAELNPNEVQTLASIVYWETKKDKDMPMVAGVYMNRIRQGIPLQADPTLIFALNDYSIKRVLNKHKQIESPYNTYKYKITIYFELLDSYRLGPVFLWMTVSFIVNGIF